ncbi:MAG: tRNA-dihydrouridine synthase family protein [Candidatus Lokiarchaeota archaeon]|nr:tRNA-dihydrouridine synthase family protein [Candidatus Lokiarchaeota archaeon]
MKLGRLNLGNRYVLAPMQRVTTAPYRRFCRKFQEIGLVSVPMIYTKHIASNSNSFEQELYKIEEERPISIQLIGSDLDALKLSIDSLESYKYDILDINAGCPSRRAINSCEGGYLMKDFERLKELLDVAVKKSSKPISLKVRTGYAQPMNIKEFSKIINNSGIDILIIHARTVKSNFIKEKIDLDTVRDLKKILKIPLIGNGDISNPKTAKHFIDYTKVDALMIGRESMGNPLIFQQIHQYFTKDKEVPFKNNRVILQKNFALYEEIIDSYLEGIVYPYGNEKFKFNELKKNAIWLTKGIEKSTSIRTRLSRAKNITQLKMILKEVEN